MPGVLMKRSAGQNSLKSKKAERHGYEWALFMMQEPALFRITTACGLTRFRYQKTRLLAEARPTELSVQ